MGKEKGHHAVNVGNRRTKADEGEHVEIPRYDRFPGPDIKNPASPQNHRRCQNELGPVKWFRSENLLEKR